MTSRFRNHISLNGQPTCLIQFSSFLDCFSEPRRKETNCTISIPSSSTLGFVWIQRMIKKGKGLTVFKCCFRSFRNKIWRLQKLVSVWQQTITVDETTENVETDRNQFIEDYRAILKSNFEYYIHLSIIKVPNSLHAFHFRRKHIIRIWIEKNVTGSPSI